MGDYHYTVNDYDFGNLTIKIEDDDILNSPISINPTQFNWNSPSYTVGIGAAGSSYTYATSPGSNGPYSATGAFSATGSVGIDTTGIEIKNGADIKINGKSLSDFMDRVESRLGILQPKPELLEKFEALKQAYEHYKTLEALCMGDIPADPNAR